MPSPDKLFRLDPVETKIVAPTTNFQVLAEAADRSVANRSLGRGLTAFSQALGGLAQFKKQQQIRDDIKTAKDAAVRGEVMPDVLPVAETAYQNVIDKNTASESLLAIERFENGEDFDTLIKSETPSAQKTDQLEVYYDDFYARAVKSMQNPDLIQNLRLTINGLKEKAYQKVYERERDFRTIEGIHALKNTLGEAKRFAEATNVPLIDTLTPNWLQANAKDLGKSHPYLSLSERKLLAFQILTTDKDVLADPQIIEEIMKSKYNKGFTFRNLYEGKGADAEEFKKIYDAYRENSTEYFNQLEADNKKAKKVRDEHLNEALANLYENGGTGAQGRELAKKHGITDIGELNKIKTEGDKYSEGEKFDRFSPEGKAFEKSLAGSKATAAEVRIAMIRRNISLTEKDYYEDLASIERTQIQQVTEVYNESIKVVKAQRISLLKGALGGGNITLPNGEINTAALQQTLLGKGLNPTDVHEILEQIQTLDLDYSNKVTKAASRAAREDNFNIGQAVNEFQNSYNTEIAGFIDNIKAGILRRKTKDVKTSGDTGEPGKETKGEPEEPSIVKDHKDLIEDPIKFKEEQTKIISEDFKASIGEQAKQQLNKPVYTLSDEDTKYYSELTKNLPPEVIAQKFAHSTANLPVVQERTLTGKDVFDIVTKGKLTEAPKKPVLKKSRTGLGPVVDEIDEAVGAVVNWFKDKPQTKHEVESTVNFLELFNKGLEKIESSLDAGFQSVEDTFSDFKSNIDKTRGKDTTERLLRTPERTPMESTPPIPMKEIVVQDTKPATKLPTVTPNKAYIESQKQKDLVSITKKVAEENNLDSKLLDILFKLESSGGKQLINIPKKGKKATTAKGVGQIIDATAKSLAKRLNTTPDKIQNDTETNVRATALLFTDALERYKDTNDPVIFAFADHHGGSSVINTARRKATDKNDIESVIKQLEITATKENTYQETIDFIRKVQKELNR